LKKSETVRFPSVGMGGRIFIPGGRGNRQRTIQKRKVKRRRLHLGDTNPRFGGLQTEKLTTEPAQGGPQKLLKPKKIDQRNIIKGKGAVKTESQNQSEK